ncbi:hypothetical protein HYC85_002566 [Camellia sinensis]|uniref:Protein RER1 n=1 Tax=Camellia sinensis TaxID=4442 RepID=A0A7J7I9Z2_CAMSI|nr:hypothetical protein HYC85_002566 [Camellia sinensis]
MIICARPGLEQYQHLLDKSTLHVLHRWITFAAIVTIYIIKVYLVQGFYIMSYGLRIYILNLLIGFISPKTHMTMAQPSPLGAPTSSAPSSVAFPSLSSGEDHPDVLRDYRPDVLGDIHPDVLCWEFSTSIDEQVLVEAWSG